MKQAFNPRYLISWIHRSFLCVSFVDPGETAFAGLPVLLPQVDAGVQHGLADHVIADVSGGIQEIA